MVSLWVAMETVTGSRVGLSHRLPRFVWRTHTYDAFHGVCHAQFLENVAALAESDGYLGAWNLEKNTDEFRLYREACNYASSRIARQPSIVNTSVISAVQGFFGDHHTTKRTEGSELFINPLMALYWTFRLEDVAQRNMYLKQIEQTITYQELSLVIETFRETLPKTRPWRAIPG
jgi:hypothetical protein